MKKQCIAFITTGYFPIPPTMGGAVENLVYTLILENEKYNKFNFIVYSSYDKLAIFESKKLKNTKIDFIKTPFIIKTIDKIIYWISTNIFKIKKNLSFRYIFQRIWYEYIVSIKIGKKDFDKIIIENTPASFLSIKWNGNSKKYKGKVFYHLHNEIGSTFKCDNEIINSNTVIGISDYINKKFMERFPKYNNELVILKNCIVENEKNNIIEDLRERYNIDKSDFLILFVGRICEEKGIFELLKAYEKLDIINLHLLIVGGNYYGSDVVSDFEKKIINIAKKLKKKVTFTGYRPFDEIKGFYYTADLAVFPAIWNEPAGLTIIEAMSTGVPIITTNSGGIPEYVGKENVILLDKSEFLIEDLANAIQSVYENLYKSKEMALKAREFSKQYTSEKYFENFKKIIGE